MKKLIGLIILSAMVLMIGCNDDSSILETTNDFTDSSPLNKGRLIPPKLDDDKDKDLDDFFLDSLSLGGNLKEKDLDDDFDYDFDDDDLVKSKYSETFVIDGKKGGKLLVEHKWKTDGKKSVVRANLNIPKGAFKGELKFDMIFDLYNYTLELYPSPYSFDKPVVLDLRFINIEVDDDVEDGDFVFNYLDGPFEDIKYHSVGVDEDSGTMIVKGAELHHFSRYGWTRKKNNDDD